MRLPARRERGKAGVNGMCEKPKDDNRAATVRVVHSTGHTFGGVGMYLCIRSRAFYHFQWAPRTSEYFLSCDACKVLRTTPHRVGQKRFEGTRGRRL